MANRVVINICGEELTFIAEESSSYMEQLRGQIKGYLDEAGRAQSEASELKREVFRLQQKLDAQARKDRG